MLKDLAASYYSHFFFGSHAGQLRLKLSERAPQQLRHLVHDVCGDVPSQESLSCLYECLCSLAEQEATIAPPSCPEETMGKVFTFLNRTGTA